VELSRGFPLFGKVRQPRDCPQALADPYISRRPLRFRIDPRGLELQVRGHGSSVFVDGAQVRNCALIPESELERGVVLMLARRTVLYLHYRRRHTPVADDCDLVGERDAIQEVREMILKVAPSTAPVLLLGESGTGKELVARALHARSERSKLALVSINMAAIPPELAGAELFGVKRGAFTGADADRRGYFRRADKGTLFMDEIGACPSAVQPILLRALQEGQIQSPGGVTESVDVRAIAATDADLEGEDSGFSEALRYRLGGFEIKLPPLRERREDIGRLLVHYLTRFRDVIDAAGDRTVARWATLVERLACHHWPGNVRELFNYCRQIEIASRGSEELTVPGNILRSLSAAAETPACDDESVPRSSSDVSDPEIQEAMLQSQWQISRAARQLEISRQALYKRIRDIPDLRTVADIPGSEVEATYYECGGILKAAAERLRVSHTALRRRWRAMELEPRDY